MKVLLEYEHRPSDGTRWRLMSDGSFRRRRPTDPGFVSLRGRRFDLAQVEYEIRRFCTVIA